MRAAPCPCVPVPSPPRRVRDPLPYRRFIVSLRCVLRFCILRTACDPQSASSAPLTASVSATSFALPANPIRVHPRHPFNHDSDSYPCPPRSFPSAASFARPAARRDRPPCLSLYLWASTGASPLHTLFAFCVFVLLWLNFQPTSPIRAIRFICDPHCEQIVQCRCAW